MNQRERNKFLRITFELALKARKLGNHPFGAILVHQNEIICQSENSIKTDNDLTKHAEFKLVQFAVQNFDQITLRNSILYSSTEPCSMCSGAIYWAKIGTLVYGTSLKTLSSMVNGTLEVSCRDILTKGKHDIKIFGPLLEVEGIKIHNGFWK